MTRNARINSSFGQMAWFALLFITVAVLVLVIVPAWIIQPFKPQTPRGLALSYTMRRCAPMATAAMLLVSVILISFLWRRSRRWLVKIGLLLVLMPLIAATWFARQNHFEWMFHPLSHSAYAKVGDASFISDSDMVLAVNNNGEVAAYPVRLMAYHHVVQDVVGGTPIAATY